MALFARDRCRAVIRGQGLGDTPPGTRAGGRQCLLDRVLAAARSLAASGRHAPAQSRITGLASLKPGLDRIRNLPAGKIAKIISSASIPTGRRVTRKVGRFATITYAAYRHRSRRLDWVAYDECFSRSNPL
jgi:hypothetical protein